MTLQGETELFLYPVRYISLKLQVIAIPVYKSVCLAFKSAVAGGVSSLL